HRGCRYSGRGPCFPPEPGASFLSFISVRFAGAARPVFTEVNRGTERTNRWQRQAGSSVSGVAAAARSSGGDRKVHVGHGVQQLVQHLAVLDGASTHTSFEAEAGFLEHPGARG